MKRLCTGLTPPYVQATIQVIADNNANLPFLLILYIITYLKYVKTKTKTWNSINLILFLIKYHIYISFPSFSKAIVIKTLLLANCSIDGRIAIKLKMNFLFIIQIFQAIQVLLQHSLWVKVFIVGTTNLFNFFNRFL